MAASDRGVPPSEKLEQMIQPDQRVQELSASGDEGGGEEDAPAIELDGSPVVDDIPFVFRTLPLLHDDLRTVSSETQDKVAETCRKFMAGEEFEDDDLNSHGIPSLQRAKHVRFAIKSLNKYPESYEAADASRPWMLYWALAAQAHLGKDVTQYYEGVMQTFTPLQNTSGGFGGGHGHLSHAAASYAATLSLAMVGGLEMINRRKMWSWLGSIKQPDGSFAMAVDGEIDIRGAYCCMTCISLLNLPLELPPDSPARKAGLHLFTDKLGDWIGRCQSYEGGIGSSPDNEAHGAYAFCGLACLSILDAPHRSVPKYLDVDTLLYWMTARQPAPEGGFSGRTNKLVDACYSHWVGGCWAILDAALTKPGQDPTNLPLLWNREAVIRYTLCCSQTKSGGLRDKPGTRQDGYHTNYSLAGLSAAQNYWYYLEDDNMDSLTADADQQGDPDAPYRWYGRHSSDAEMHGGAFDYEDTVGFVHPIFVIPPEAVTLTKAQFEGVVGFKDATGSEIPIR